MLKVNKSVIDLIEKDKYNFPLDLKDKDQYAEKLMRVGAGGSLRSFFVYPVSRKRVKKISNQVKQLVNLLLKLNRYIIDQDNSLLKNLQLDNLDIEGLKKRDPASFFTYGRADMMLSKAGFKLIEFNAKRPQVFEDIDWYVSFLKRHIPEIRTNYVSKSIVNAFKQAYFANTASSPEAIALFCGHINYLRKSGIKSSYLSNLKKTFPKSDILVFSCKDIENFFKDLSVKDKKLVYKRNNKNVALIIAMELCHLYDNKGGIADKNIKRAYNAGYLEILPHPSSMIIGSKIALSLLFEKEIQEKLNFNAEDKKAVKIVPRSFSFSHKYNIKHLDKDNLVIKYPRSGDGKKVYIGSEISDNKFVTLANKSIKHKGKIVFQEKVKTGKAAIVPLKKKKLTQAALSLEPFIINDLEKKSLKVIGFSSAAILESEIKQYPRFNPAGPEVRFCSLVIEE